MIAHCPIQKQHGIATLLVSIILLSAATMLTLYQSRHTIMDLKITTKELNHGIAQEIAQSGLEQGIAYLLYNHTLIGNNEDPNGWMNNTPKWQVCNDAQVPCGDGNNKLFGNEMLVYRNVDNIHNNFDIPGVTLKVHYMTSNFNGSGAPNPLPNIKVVSEATANGNKAYSIMQRSIQAKGLFSSLPHSALLINGDANKITGNFNVWGDPNGYDNGPLSIWASGAVLPLKGSAATYDVTTNDGQYPNTTNELSNKRINAGDIVENDANFPSDLFFYTFGIQKQNAATLKEKATVLSDCRSLNVKSKGLYWIEDNCYITGMNGDIGSPRQPVTLVITNTLNINANTNLYGVIYAHNTTTKIRLNGTADIHGSMIIDTDFTLAAGTANVHFDEQVINNANLTGGTFNYMLGTLGKYR